MEPEFISQSIAVDDILIDIDSSAKEYKELCDKPSHEQLQPGGHFSVISDGTSCKTHVYYTDSNGNNVDVTTGIRGLNIKIDAEQMYPKLSLDVICFDIPHSKFSMVFKNLTSENTEILSLYNEADRGDEEASIKLAVELDEKQRQSNLSGYFDKESFLRDTDSLSDEHRELDIHGYALGSNMPVLTGMSGEWFLYANDSAKKGEVALSYAEWKKVTLNKEGIVK